MIPPWSATRAVLLAALVVDLASIAGCGSADGQVGAVPLAGGSGGATAAGGAPAAAGGPGSVPESARRICDGSSGIRFFRGAFGAGLSDPFSAVLTDLGYGFLYVDGACHYWVQSPEQPTPGTEDPFYAWRAYREGVLTGAEETSLHDAVGYDDFLHDGPTCQMLGGAADQGPDQIWDGQTLYSCFTPVGSQLSPLLIELYAGGTDMSGPIRIQVGTGEVGDLTVYPWPLATPPGSLGDGLADGVPFAITDPSDAAALRALRTKVLADATTKPGLFDNRIRVDGTGTLVTFRDELPFTDATGAWKPPAP